MGILLLISWHVANQLIVSILTCSLLSKASQILLAKCQLMLEEKCSLIEPLVSASLRVSHHTLLSLLILPFPASAAPAREISSNSEASEADPSIVEERSVKSKYPLIRLRKMEKIVSDDANIADEKNLPKPEVVAEDPVGTPEELALSESVTEEAPEPPAVSIARELADATVDTNGVEPPVEAPKEPAISETVAEEVKDVDESSEVSGADSSNIVEHDNPVEPEPSEPTYVEKPSDEEVVTNAVEVSLQIPKEDLSLNGDSDVVPSEAKEVQVETLVAEKNVEDHNADSDHNVSETIEVAELVAEPELDAKQEKPEKNLDIEMATSTETTQSIAEGVEVSIDAKDENLEEQNSNLVEAESNVPSDDKQCESKELETELKPNRQTLLDTFENGNTEGKEQETVQVGARSLTETKADEEVTKAELSGKKPKTIISKVKQSIVKVKKALIGKSPSSKTKAPEGIDETKAK